MTDKGPSRESLEKFFSGIWYPVAVAVLVLLGHITRLEVVGICLNSLLFLVGMCICRSARPIVMFLSGFVFQLTPDNSPGTPAYSDYYFTGWRLYVMILAGVMITAAAVTFIVRNSLWRGIISSRVPMLVPLIALGVGFLVNGAFSSAWTHESLMLGAVEAFYFIFIFLILYQGLRRENTEELCDYLIFCSALLAGVLIAELGFIYLTSDTLFAGGGIVKEAINFGWGTWATAGVFLCVLIPVLFLGFMKNEGRAAWIYLAIASLTAVAALLTMSRNGQLFGVLTYGVCVVIGAFFGKHKRVCRVLSITAGALVILALGAALILFREKLADAVGEFLFDNGRLSLWGKSLSNFASAPVFGVGFFGFGMSIEFEAVGFMPTMAHNYILEIMSSMGIFGLLCYLFYQVCAFLPALRTPSLSKTMLAISAAVMLLMSLLDNFFLYFHTTFHYSVVTVLLSLMSKGDKDGPSLGLEASEANIKNPKIHEGKSQ